MDSEVKEDRLASVIVRSFFFIVGLVLMVPLIAGIYTSLFVPDESLQGRGMGALFGIGFIFTLLGSGFIATAINPDFLKRPVLEDE